jgi:hypothetical protein
MTTGPEGSADYEFGVRYREILAQSGVKLQLLPTETLEKMLKILKTAKEN